MFDIGFSELIVIALVALVVIGPERLPRVARTVGALLGRAQRYVNEVKADIQNEVNLGELKNISSTFQDAARSVEQSVTEFGKEMDEIQDSVNLPLTPPTPEYEETAMSGTDNEESAQAEQLDLALEATGVAVPAQRPDPFETANPSDTPSPANTPKV